MMLPEDERRNFPNIIVRNSNGIKILDGVSKFKESNFLSDENKVKFMTVSQNGKRVSWISNGKVCVAQKPDWKQIGALCHPKALEVCFSPSGDYLAVLDIFLQISGQDPVPNLSIYDVLEKKLVKTFVQRSQEGWKPQWTKNESILGRLTGSQVLFYENNDLDTYKNQKTFPKLKAFSISPSINNHHVAFFVPSIKSSPAYVQLMKYPNFQDNTGTIARQNFFKVDSVEVIWNRTSSAILLLTSSEPSKDSKSYYGEQMLFYLNTRGQSNRVTFTIAGNIRSLAWLPNGREFFCVYGISPAKATLFNSKCDPVKEFGEGPRNLVLVNPQGNLVLIGAMGNISPRFEIWDVEKAEQIGYRECSDTTFMEWSPCGQFFLTSTCSPRLRVNNGYRVWHYSTSLQYEQLCTNSEELYSALWQPNETESVTSFEVSRKMVPGMQVQLKNASKERYVPPSKRTLVGLGTVDTTKKYLSQLDTTETTKPKKNHQKKKKIVEGSEKNETNNNENGEKTQNKKTEKIKKEETGLRGGDDAVPANQQDVKTKKKQEKKKVMLDDWRAPKTEEELAKDEKLNKKRNETKSSQSGKKSSDNKANPNEKGKKGKQKTCNEVESEVKEQIENLQL